MLRQRVRNDATYVTGLDARGSSSCTLGVPVRRAVVVPQWSWNVGKERLGVE